MLNLLYIFGNDIHFDVNLPLNGSTTFPFLTIFVIFQLSFESNVKTVIVLGA